MMDQERDPKHDEMLRQFIASRMQRLTSASMDRRSFMKRAAGGAAVAAGAGFAGRILSPQAAAAAAATLQQGGDSADAAVAAAKTLKVDKLTIISESALQAEDPKSFSGPMWKQLTGINLEVIEKPFAELFPTMVQEHIGATGSIDILQIVPAWLADFVEQGVAEPLDDYIAKYMNKADLADFHPLYRDLMNYGGKIYGLFDDGDVLVGYYRKDLFQDPKNKDAFKAKTGKELAAPATWEDYDAIQSFFTEQGAGKLWGGASQRLPAQSNHWFTQEFRVRGGKFFNPDTMDATLDSQAGVDTLTRMLNSNKSMPKGVETWGFVEVMKAWLAGQLAMVGCTWPPYGRFSEDYGKGTQQMNWVPPSQVSGKVGYFVMPGGYCQMASGFLLGVSADSKNKEAAYLYVQWANSPKISLQRCMLPYSLRDPYRLSHYASPEYRAKWANAGEYLDTLKASADKALLDIIMPGNNDFENTLDQLWGDVQGGKAIKDALANANKKFNDVTDKTGRDKAKAAYAEYLKLKGAYPQG